MRIYLQNIVYFLAFSFPKAGSPIAHRGSLMPVDTDDRIIIESREPIVLHGYRFIIAVCKLFDPNRGVGINLDGMLTNKIGTWLTGVGNSFVVLKSFIIVNQHRIVKFFDSPPGLFGRNKEVAQLILNRS